MVSVSHLAVGQAWDKVGQRRDTLAICPPCLHKGLLLFLSFDEVLGLCSWILVFFVQVLIRYRMIFYLAAGQLKIRQTVLFELLFDRRQVGLLDHFPTGQD